MKIIKLHVELTWEYVHTYIHAYTHTHTHTPILPGNSPLLWFGVTPSRGVWTELSGISLWKSSECFPVSYCSLCTMWPHTTVITLLTFTQ